MYLLQAPCCVDSLAAGKIPAPDVLQASVSLAGAGGMPVALSKKLDRAQSRHRCGPIVGYCRASPRVRYLNTRTREALMLAATQASSR